MKGLRDLVEALDRPEDYFSGLEWGGRLLPERILCFKRLQQDHATSGWEGISAKAGRYDQHGRFVLLIALEGEGKLGVESQVWALKVGDALLLFPHQVHYYVELAEEFCWLFVSFELRPQDEKRLIKLRGGPRQPYGTFKVLLETFLESYHEGEPLAASVRLAEMLVELENGLQAGIPQEHPEEDSLVVRVKRYVMENLERGLSNPELADEMKVSESYLRAMFREEAGVSMAHFVRSARLVKASYLLDKGKLTMTEIADCCGFQSVTSFTRAFRRTYEMTPTDYRKRYAS